MIKTFLTFSICILMLCQLRIAKADFEAFQKVNEAMGKLEYVKAYANESMKKASEMQKLKNEGEGFVKQTIEKAQTNPLGAGEELMNTSLSDIPDINNVGKASEQVGKVYNRQAGQGNDNQMAQDQKQKMMEIQRENVANLYAVAFTTRTLLAKERQEDEHKNDMENTRELIKLTNQKAAEMLGRLRNIMKLEAALAEFQITQRAASYSVTSTEETDTGDDK